MRYPFHRLRGFAATAFLTAAVAAMAAAPTASADDLDLYPPGTRACGSFNAGYTISVFAQHVRCRRARRIQRELWLGDKSRQTSVNGGSGADGYILLDRFPGWKCVSGSGGGSCSKGRRVAAYQN